MKAPIRFEITVPRKGEDELAFLGALIDDLADVPTFTGDVSLKVLAGKDFSAPLIASRVVVILKAAGVLTPDARISATDARTDDRLESNGLVVEISGATSPEAAGAEAILLNLSTWFVNREASHAVA